MSNETMILLLENMEEIIKECKLEIKTGTRFEEVIFAYVESKLEEIKRTSNIILESMNFTIGVKNQKESEEN